MIEQWKATREAIRLERTGQLNELVA